MLHKILGQDILNGLFKENILTDKYGNPKKTANAEKIQVYPDTIAFRRPKTEIKTYSSVTASTTSFVMSSDDIKNKYTFTDSSKIILAYKMGEETSDIVYTLNIFVDKTKFNDYTATDVNFVGGNYKHKTTDGAIPDSSYNYINDENNEFFLEGVYNKANNTLTSLTIYRKSIDAWGNFTIGIQKSDDIFLGLFTQMPTNPYTGEGFVEPSVDRYNYNNETQNWEVAEKILCKEYRRLNVNRNSAFQKNTRILGSTINDENIPQVFNQEMIVFPEARGMDRYFYDKQEADPTALGINIEEKGWGKIVGFGLFYYDIDGKLENSDLLGNVPFLWGTISDGTTENNEFVNVEANTVPIIRVNGLRITME